MHRIPFIHQNYVEHNFCGGAHIFGGALPTEQEIGTIMRHIGQALDKTGKRVESSTEKPPKQRSPIQAQRDEFIKSKWAAAKQADPNRKDYMNVRAAALREFRETHEGTPPRSNILDVGADIIAATLDIINKSKVRDKYTKKELRDILRQSMLEAVKNLQLEEEEAEQAAEQAANPNIPPKVMTVEEETKKIEESERRDALIQEVMNEIQQEREQREPEPIEQPGQQEEPERTEMRKKQDAWRAKFAEAWAEEKSKPKHMSYNAFKHKYSKTHPNE